MDNNQAKREPVAASSVNTTTSLQLATSGKNISHTFGNTSTSQGAQF